MKINAILSHNKLTLSVSMNGSLSRKTFSTKEDAIEAYKFVLSMGNNPSEEDMLKFKAMLTEKHRIAYLVGFENDFNTGNVYLAGFNTPVPTSLLRVAESYYEDDLPLDTITNFWKLLMLNPDKEIREKLFGFIEKHDFVLTKNGYMMVYKAVYNRQTLDGWYSTKLIDAIKEFETKVRGWNCTLNKYTIYKDLENNEFKITKTITADKWAENADELKIEILGKLGDVKTKTLGTADNPIYTDMHSKTMDIKLGQVVQMDRTKCDANSKNECSYGLHVGATKYVENFANRDSEVLVCLINPANVVAVPDYDRTKLRVSEYYPYAIANRDGKTIIVPDSQYSEDDYMDIEADELESLIEKIKEGDLPIQTAQKAEPETRSLDELKKIIESRLIDINS